MTLNIVIKAAGKGTRMHSALPKVLQPLAGRSLLQHVLDMARQLHADRIIVVTGYEAERVEAEVAAPDLHFVRQQPQLGTGHAAQQAVPALCPGGTTLILNGDVPLVEVDTARRLVASCQGEQLALLTVELDDPAGYGRIVRRGLHVQRIVEHKDADTRQREIREVYSGMMAAPTELLKGWLARLTNHNSQGEYYLTDVVALANADGVPVVASQANSDTEVLGVNNLRQLAELERRVQIAQAETLMDRGVRLIDPARFDLRGTLECGLDVEIDVNCVFEGKVVLGDGVRIGANCVIRDAEIAAGAEIRPYTHIEGASIGARAQVGPYARLRPGAALGEEVHIGNFVEVKNAVLGRGSKANHLAYLGDATIGERMNFGAGSITANYDGVNKHRTVIGNDVHVGSNCVLVAPVTLEDGATIGGGSTIVAKAPAGQLTVARARQVTIPGWKRPAKKQR